MPPQLSFAEVRQKVLNENLTLGQIESYIRSLLPRHDPGTMNVLAQALWNTRNDTEFRPEFEAQWRSLSERLRREYEMVDELEEEAARKERERLIKERELRLETERQLAAARERERRANREAADALEEDGLAMVAQGAKAAVAAAGPTAAQMGRVAAQETRDAAESKILAARIAGAAAAKASAAAGAGAKAVGRWSWAGLKAGGRGLKAAGGAIGDVARTPVSGEGLALWLFFVLTLAWHLIVVFWFDFNVPLYLSAVVGTALCVAWWWFSDREGSEFVFALFITVVSILAYMLAANTYGFFSNPDVVNGVPVVIAFFPLWPIAMWAKAANRHPGSKSDWLLKAYFFLWLIIVLVLFVWPILGSALGALPPIGDRVDVGGATVGFWDLLTERWNRVTNRVSAIGQYYTNPDYYTGRVDENQGKPLGVTISDLRPVDPEVANDSQMILFANVETKSFIGEQVQILPACVIERADAPPIATVDPNVLEIVYGTTGSFECTFEPPQGDWRRGVYSIKASATFPFQTWGYLPYTFVDEELARNLARQGLEVRRELDIDQDPDAVYTSGPIILGMGGTDQPILVRREDEANNYLAPGSRIGVTLDSGWQDGEITAVHEIHLKVPESFILTSCDRAISRTEADQNAPGYVSYVFENPTDTSVAIDYTTITCKLGLASAEDAANLVAAGDKAERSFVAVAMYDYTTEEKTSVRVR